MNQYAMLQHLKALRDHVDGLVKYLEAVEEYNAKNTMVVRNPAANGAAPGLNFNAVWRGTIGDAPQPPSIPHSDQ